MNVRYGSSPGFLGPAPKFLGIAVDDKVYNKSNSACVNGYVSLRHSICSKSDLMPTPRAALKRNKSVNFQ